MYPQNLILPRILIMASSLSLFAAFTANAQNASTKEEWRSSLFPEDWKPGFKDDEGRFLHDFSYAGYERGEKPLPEISGPILDVTKTPYSADPTGKADSTQAIQAAIDEAGRLKGGVVYLPEGIYKVLPEGESVAALKINQDHVVLRGAGAEKTFIFNDENRMRNKSVILVKADDATKWSATNEEAKFVLASADLPNGTMEIPVEDVSPFAAGDLVMVRNDPTPRFIESLGMTGKWTQENLRNRGLMFWRRITAIDSASKILSIDVPLRYELLKADNARVLILPGKSMTGIGIESLSIGMKFHPGTEMGLLDFNKEGTAGYEVHQAGAIAFESSENCWVRGVNSYSAPDNPNGVHLLSNGIRISRSRLITIEDCDFKNPQYLGEGGNGYHFIVQGNDSMLKRCKATGGRHNYSLGSMGSSGNVFLDCLAKDGFLASDFHMQFSVSNLFDNTICDGDFLEAKFRPYGGTPMHGVTTSQSVFWNTEGVRYIPSTHTYGERTSTRPQQIILSEQFGEGYVIGTRGPAPDVRTTNFSEGIGEGADLIPRSLYRDQLKRRIGEP